MRGLQEVLKRSMMVPCCDSSKGGLQDVQERFTKVPQEVHDGFVKDLREVYEVLRFVRGPWEQASKSPTFSYFFTFLLLFPTFDWNSYFFLLLRIFAGFKVDAGPQVSYFFTFSATFPTFDWNSYFFLLFRISAGFKVDAILNVFVNPWVSWAGGGISGNSMVSMLRPDLLRLSSGGWDKRGCIPPLPGESLVELWVPLQGVWHGIGISSW